jgi:hypothetical protein
LAAHSGTIAIALFRRSIPALAAWIAVRTAASRWSWFLLATLPAVLAVAVKYAGLLFVPTIAVLPALAGWPERGRRMLWYLAAFVAAVPGLPYGATRLGGSAYMNAVSSTTTNRAQGITQRHHPARGSRVGRRTIPRGGDRHRRLRVVGADRTG